jgi:GAF domain-containing protein
MAGQDSELAAVMIEFADTLVSDYDLLDYLDRLLERSIVALDADAGGVMLASGEEGARLQLLASTDERTRVLELVELQHQEGPCVDSHRHGEQVVVPDLTRWDRWPRFTPAVLDRGYRSVYAFPLRLRDTVIGAFNLYREQPGSVAPAEIRVAQAFADMATIGILQERAVRESRELAGHLQAALHSRVVIEQAKGIVAERLGCNMDEAYQAIRWHGRNENRRLREVAAALVAGALAAEALRPPS